MHLKVKFKAGEKVLRPGEKILILKNYIELEFASVEHIAQHEKKAVARLREKFPSLSHLSHWPRFRFPDVQPDHFQIVEDGKAKNAIPSHYWDWHQLQGLPLILSLWDENQAVQEARIELIES